MIKYASNSETASKAFASVATYARAYAKEQGKQVYFFGDPELTKYTRLDAVYTPSRFYHTSAFAQRYRNKILRPCIGVGYSYALSPLILQDTLASVSKGTKAIFDFDHWDSSQDDLRRMMELNAANRWYVFEQSMRNARTYGALIELPMDSCGGCTPRNAVVDSCEARPTLRRTTQNTMRFAAEIFRTSSVSSH